MILPRKHWWSRLWRLANAAALFAGWCLLLGYGVGRATDTLDLGVLVPVPAEPADWIFLAMYAAAGLAALVITLNHSDYAFAWRCWRERPR
jgi:hypothetical protein